MASSILPYGNNVARDVAVVTLSDSTDLTVSPCGGFICGTAGNVKVTTAEGTTAILYGLLAGVVYPIRITRFWSTSTTATNLTALY